MTPQGLCVAPCTVSVLVRHLLGRFHRWHDVASCVRIHWGFWHEHRSQDCVQVVADQEFVRHFAFATSPTRSSACPVCFFPLLRWHLLFYSRTKYLLLKMQTGECMLMHMYRSSFAKRCTISRASLLLICK